MATDNLAPAMQQMLACAQDGLTFPVGRAHLAPGDQVAFDECCEGGGQLWVRLVDLRPSGTNTRQQRGFPCGVVSWRASLAVGVIRCAHTVDESGNAPTVDQLNGDTLAMTQDCVDLMQAIQCCFSGTIADLQWDPLGPEGGCVGGEWSFTRLFDNCPCPD